MRHSFFPLDYLLQRLGGKEEAECTDSLKDACGNRLTVYCCAFLGRGIAVGASTVAAILYGWVFPLDEIASHLHVGRRGVKSAKD